MKWTVFPKQNAKQYLKTNVINNMTLSEQSQLTQVSKSTHGTDGKHNNEPPDGAWEREASVRFY